MKHNSKAAKHREIIKWSSVEVCLQLVASSSKDVKFRIGNFSFGCTEIQRKNGPGRATMGTDELIGTSPLEFFQGLQFKYWKQYHATQDVVDCCCTRKSKLVKPTNAHILSGE